MMQAEISHTAPEAENIFGIIDKGSPRYTRIKSLFDGLGLPLPGAKETYGSTYGYLVFLTDFGTVLRFTGKQDAVGFNNPHFIKPLFTRDAGDMIFSIDPGLRCPVTMEESKKIYRTLREQYGLIVGDEKPHNLAFIPGTDFPVVIDLDNTFVSFSWAALRADVQEVKNMIARQSPTPQDTLYAPLRQAINAAWPEENPTPDSTGIKKFFDLCREFKNAGKLLSIWDNPSNNYRNTTTCAAAYKEKLHAFGIGGAV